MTCFRAIAVFCVLSIAVVIGACGGGGSPGGNYTLSGTVYLDGSPRAGVAVILSGDENLATVTDGSGDYFFTGLKKGDYTVTPFLEGESFDPAYRDVSLTQDSAGNDFNFASRSISGKVTLNGAGYEGAMVALAGSSSGTTTTDANGDYSFTGLLAGSYTVTPSVTGQELAPASASVALGGTSSTGNDFTLVTHLVSGTVTMNGVSLPGVAVSLTGIAPLSAATATDSSGAFSFPGLLNGSYTVTPHRDGQTFTPASTEVTVANGDDTSSAFALDTFDITGQVTWAGSGFARGGTVTLSGGTDLIVNLDGAGSYSFVGLPNGTYTVTPFVTGQALTPGSASIILTGGDETGHDFALVTHAVSGAVTMNGAPYSGGAAIELSGAQSLSTETDASGAYSFHGLLDGAYTVTPSVTGQTLTPTAASLTLAGDDSSGNDFALDTFAIAGKVTHGGVGKSGVFVALLGAVSLYDVTDSSGNYSFPGLANGDYTVTPSLYAQVIAPTERAVTLAGGSATTEDFNLPSIIWYADKDGVSATQDGLSWATAVLHPQNAVDVASSGDQVWVAEGVYASLDTTDPALPVLAMKDGVGIYGGFAGVEASLDARDLAAHHTTLDGKQVSRHAVIGADDATLDGFGITGGGWGADIGGGLLATDCTGLTVRWCDFIGNSVTNTAAPWLFGAGIGGYRCGITVERCRFLGNIGIGSSAGGGMAIREGSVATITDSLFAWNVASRSGGIFMADSTATIANCTITRNDGYPDGIYGVNSTLSLVNSIYWESDAMQFYGGSLTVTSTDLNNADPRFVNEGTGDFRLQVTSPCIDAGSNAAVTTSLDLDGYPRIEDGNADGTATVDMGCYESGPVIIFLP